MCETGEQRKLGVEQLGTKTQKDATRIPLDKDVCAVCYEAKVLSKVTTLLLQKATTVVRGSVHCVSLMPKITMGENYKS